MEIAGVGVAQRKKETAALQHHGGRGHTIVATAEMGERQAGVGRQAYGGTALEFNFSLPVVAGAQTLSLDWTGDARKLI
jgi:hypothetical protein